MVAYSFQRQFEAPMIARTKIQTLRNDRKRHARVGETLQLYTGMRTRACRLIGLATCERVDAITIDFRSPRIEIGEARRIYTPAGFNAFATADGFPSWDLLETFWRKHHPAITDSWTGVRIQWGSTFRLPDEQGPTDGPTAAPAP